MSQSLNSPTRKAELASAKEAMAKDAPEEGGLRATRGVENFTAKPYDLEVFSSAQKRWLEVSSVSNFETFQANRLK